MFERDKGHNQGKENQKLEPSNPLALFDSGPHFAYTYKKTERIIAALYMVTGLMPDQEPLKWKMRSHATDLLTLTNNLKDKYSSGRQESIHSIKSLFLEMASFLHIARESGLVSTMNAGILLEEMTNLLGLFTEDKRFEAGAKNLVIDKSFFDEESLGFRYVPEARQDRASVKDKRPAFQGGQPFRVPVKPSPSEDRGVSEGSIQEKRDKRRKVILDLVKRKGNITIRDVAEVIDDWSDKTVQRELLALVAEGVLKKEGERRWSRYSLQK